MSRYNEPSAAEVLAGGPGVLPREIFKEMKENWRILGLFEGCCVAKIPEPDGEAITLKQFWHFFVITQFYLV